MAERTETRFLHSALSEESRFFSTAEALAWLDEELKMNGLEVQPVPFAELQQWSFAAHSGDLVHRSGKFFRIEGIRVRGEARGALHWDQPIIDQPEIGILGIIVKEFDGLLYFLMQAKMEPGNPSGVQLTPTVQATKSNYTMVHQGKRPLYVEYFLDHSLAPVLVDQLQPEQGSTFLGKRNRNMIVEVTDDIPVAESFRWFTLGQIKQLLNYPNLVSMDARTVLSCIAYVEPRSVEARTAASWGLLRGHHESAPPSAFGARLLASMAECGTSLHSDAALLSWLTDLKCRYECSVSRIGLTHIEGWESDHSEIRHLEQRFFRVLGVRVQGSNREVARWDQPLVQPSEKGLIAFLTKEINGVLHMLVQGKVEPGNLDTVVIGPTVQCTLSNSRLDESDSWPPFLQEARHPHQEQIRYSCVQAEEGGRFYHAENVYRLIELPESTINAEPEGYCWVTLRQLNDLLRYGFVNVEARSLLACLNLA